MAPSSSAPSPVLRAGVAAVFLGWIALAWVLAHREGLAPRPASGSLGFTFEEVGARAGLSFVHREVAFDPKIGHIMPQVAGLGAAASVTDVDGDGWPDVYLTSSADGARNALYRNRRDGTFEDVAAAAGIADCNRDGVGTSMGSIWADIDNDGFEDCFLYKYGYPQLFRHEGLDGSGTPRFRDITEGSGLRRWLNTNAACWIDYDRDGLVDLFVAGYFPDDVDLWHLKTTKIMQDSMEFSKNGGSHLLFKNLGGGRFEDVTAKLGVGGVRWTLACASADFDGDGWPDLFVANDYGTEQLYVNRRGERFEEATGVGLNLTSKSGMSVAAGDCANRGILDAFVTNIYKAGFSPQGNNLRMNRLASDRRFSNVAEGEVADCGWAWGSQFGDFDNDGFVDLFVANGFVSADPQRDYWYDMARVAGGAGGVIQDAANWAPMEGRSLSGFERSRVLRNNGDGSFTDVAAACGVTDLLDGRAVALADFFHTGAQDVLVANQRERALLYHAKPDPNHRWVQFRLVATKSNRSAIGAQVLLRWENDAGAQRQARLVDGGSGFSAQNERKLHFGLGAGARALSATVTWPSGARQDVAELVPGEVKEIREP